LYEGCHLKPHEHWNWYFVATLLAHGGDTAGYRKHCHEMLARFGGTINAPIAERTVKACLLLPLDGPDLKATSQLADTAITVGAQDAWAPFYLLAKGLAD
jgi:hypothetical protein